MIKQGHLVDILASDDVFNDTVLIPKIDSWNLKFKNILKVIRIVKECRYDHVILNDINLSMFSLVFRLAGIKTYSLLHMELDYVHSIKNKVIRYILQWSRIVAINIGCKFIFNVNKMNERYLIKDKQVFVGNVLPNVENRSKQSSFPKIYDYIYIGRLSHEKNLFKMLDYFRYCKSKQPNFKALIVGEGSLEEELLHYTENLGLSKVIDFYGFADRGEIEKLFRISRCNILYSFTEGFPTTILEASYYNVPSLVTNVGSCGFISKKFPNVVKAFDLNAEYKDLLIISDRLKKSFSIDQKNKLIEEFSSKNITNVILSRM